MKRFELRLTKGAVRDLDEIYRYIVEHRSVAEADHVFDRILDAVDNLRRFPDRGVCPRELETTGFRQFREVFFKPYRIIYSVAETRVHILVIADGRRDFKSLLARRLLS